MTKLLGCLALTLVLLLQGCGGDDDDDTSSGGGTKFCLDCSGLSGSALLNCKVQNAKLGCE